MRSAIDSWNSLSHPVNASNTNPPKRLMRNVIGCGIVNARTSPPLARAKSVADN